MFYNIICIIDMAMSCDIISDIACIIDCLCKILSVCGIDCIIIIIIGYCMYHHNKYYLFCSM